MAQALLNEQGREEGARLLQQGATPAQVISAIRAPAFDPLAPWRQYGVVTLKGQAAGFTGESNGRYAADLQGKVDRLVYSIQGNILTSRKVLSAATQAFQRPACDLAARLLAALLAGAENGEGDSRCRPASPSDAAFLRVDNPDGTVFIRLDVKGQRDPLGLLQRHFERFRQQHGCTLAPHRSSTLASRIR
jgi:uncharacterized Ntn-hydrolase superfamily protein